MEEIKGAFIGNEPDHVMQFFTYNHLKTELQDTSKPFCELADFIQTLPRNPQRTIALNHLLLAKDAAARAKLAK